MEEHEEVKIEEGAKKRVRMWSGKHILHSRRRKGGNYDKWKQGNMNEEATGNRVAYKNVYCSTVFINSAPSVTRGSQ